MNTPEKVASVYAEAEHHLELVKVAQDYGVEVLPPGYGEALLKEAKKKGEKTYPFSRAVTSYPLFGGLGALQGAASGGYTGGVPGAIGGGVIGAGLGLGSAALARGISARATLGRAAAGQTGRGASEQKVIRALQKTKTEAKGTKAASYIDELEKQAKEVSSKEYHSAVFRATTRPKKNEGRVARFFREKGLAAPTTDEYRAGMRATGETGWPGARRAAVRAGKGALIGGALGAGAGALAGGRRFRRLGATAGAGSGTVLGGLVGLDVSNMKAFKAMMEAEREHLKGKGITTEKTPRSGIAGKIGLKKTTYHMTSGAQKKFGKKASFIDELEKQAERRFAQ